MMLCENKHYVRACDAICLKVSPDRPIFMILHTLSSFLIFLRSLKWVKIIDFWVIEIFAILNKSKLMYTIWKWGMCQVNITRKLGLSDEGGNQKEALR